MILLVCFISALYVYIMTSQKKTDIVDSIDYTVPILDVYKRQGFYFYEIVVPQAKDKRFKPSLGVEEE